MELALVRSPGPDWRLLVDGAKSALAHKLAAKDGTPRTKAAVAYFFNLRSSAGTNCSAHVVIRRSSEQAMRQRLQQAFHACVCSTPGTVLLLSTYARAGTRARAGLCVSFPRFPQRARVTEFVPRKLCFSHSFFLFQLQTLPAARAIKIASVQITRSLFTARVSAKLIR